eukprot:4112129-Alexandrium_andersonii.AAC.1
MWAGLLPWRLGRGQAAGVMTYMPRAVATHCSRFPCTTQHASRALAPRVQARPQGLDDLGDARQELPD